MPRKSQYELSPLYAVSKHLPPVSDDLLKRLTEDIKTNGLMDPIKLDGEGRIIDGRARYKACFAASVVPRFSEWKGPKTDECYAAYFVAHNAIRNNFPTEMARTAFVLEITKRYPAHRPTVESVTANKGATIAPLLSVSGPEIAKSLGIKNRTLQMRKAALDVATESEKADLMTGKTGVKTVLAAHKAEAKAAEPLLDACGNEVPEHLRASWEVVVAVVKPWLKTAQSLRTEIRSAGDRESAAFAWLSVHEVIEYLGNVIHVLKEAMPHVVCSYCTAHQKTQASCDNCKSNGKHYGWIPRRRYKQELPALKWKTQERTGEE